MINRLSLNETARSALALRVGSLYTTVRANSQWPTFGILMVCYLPQLRNLGWNR